MFILGFLLVFKQGLIFDNPDNRDQKNTAVVEIVVNKAILYRAVYYYLNK